MLPYEMAVGFVLDLAIFESSDISYVLIEPILLRRENVNNQIKTSTFYRTSGRFLVFRKFQHHQKECAVLIIMQKSFSHQVLRLQWIDRSHQLKRP